MIQQKISVRLMSVFLSLMLLISMLPTSVFADSMDGSTDINQKSDNNAKITALFISEGLSGSEYGSTDPNNPAVIQAYEGDSINLIAQVSGGDNSGYTYVWYKDNSVIPEAVSSSYTVENYNPSEYEGNYSVTVSQGENTISLYWKLVSVQNGEINKLSTTYDIWVDGVQVTDLNANDIFSNGTVRYDSQSNTLYLNGASLGNSVHSGYGIAAPVFADDSVGDLKISVTGKNSINTTQFGTITAGIYAFNNIIFEGDGELSVFALSLGSEGNAVYSHIGNVTVNSGTYTFEGDGTGCYGIFANSNSGTVFVNGGTFTAKAGASGNGGAAVGGNLDFSSYSNSKITASVKSDGSDETTYIPDNQNIYRLYKYIKIEPEIIQTPEYDEYGFDNKTNSCQPAQLLNGVYQIKNAGNLFWFAQQVKISGEGTVMNAELVNDIIIPEGRVWTPITVDKQSTSGVPYTGTFNGNGYTISGLVTEEKHGGLFKTLQTDSVVKNLGIINSVFNGGGSDYVGAIAATNYGTIENCYNTSEINGQLMFAGGIVGENKGTVKNCYNTGNVTVNGQGEGGGGICGTAVENAVIENCYNTGNISGRWGISGICGYFSATTIRISNCYNIGQINVINGGYPDTVHGIAYAKKETAYQTVAENCYYISDTADEKGGKTSSQFACGEVAWLLNGAKSDGIWGQTINTDISPVLNGSKVYAGYEFCYSDSISYSNDSSKVHTQKPSHDFTKLNFDQSYHWYSCANEGCNETQQKLSHNGGTATYFKKAVCQVCDQEYGTLLDDNTAPTGIITIGENSWSTLISSITFNIFLNGKQKIEITASDDSYSHTGYTDDKAVTIEYYLHNSSTPLTQEELEKLQFTEYTDAFNTDISGGNNNYIVYAKLTDHAGNITYISSDGIVFDSNYPVISGVDNNGTYYTTQQIIVTDDNLKSVTVNGNAVSESFTLAGNTDMTYVITANDKSGNTITYTVIMKSIASLGSVTDNLTTDNVTSADKDDITNIQQIINEIDTSNATAEEKSQLKEILDDCAELIEKIDAVTNEITDLTNSADSFDKDTITSSDKIKVDDLLNRIDEILSGNNLTDEEKENLNYVKEDCIDLLDKINSVIKDITDLTNSVNSFDENTVTSADKENINKILNKIDNLLNSNNLTDKEKEMVNSLKNDCDALNKKVENAQQAANSENINKADNITADNVNLDDKNNLNTAKEELENALNNFGSNYTVTEKAELEDKLEQINNALTTIKNVETLNKDIEALPETVEPDETELEEMIDKAKEKYDSMTEHEKSLVSQQSKDKLNSLLADLINYRIIEGDGSQWTNGSNGSITMKANGSVSKFKGIKIDGEDVSKDNYTVKSGSTIITLKPDYLNSLSVGKHTLTVIYTDGDTSGEFEIFKKFIPENTEDIVTSPQTGISIKMYICNVLIITAAFIFMVSASYVYKNKYIK